MACRCCGCISVETQSVQRRGSPYWLLTYTLPTSHARTNCLYRTRTCRKSLTLCDNLQVGHGGASCGAGNAATASPRKAETCPAGSQSTGRRIVPGLVSDRQRALTGGAFLIRWLPSHSNVQNKALGVDQYASLWPLTASNCIGFELLFSKAAL